MIRLSDILYGVALRETAGDMDRGVTSVVIDSREASADALFVAVPGTRHDGHDHIEAALEAGATVILCERMPKALRPNATYLRVDDARESAGLAAANFHGNPSRQLIVLGVTGTNGKTTVATLLYRLFSGLGYPVGLLSTVENRIGDRVLPATHTTPDAVRLQALLAEMVAAGCSHVCMEVSSHAAHQRRVAGVDFDVALFTNLSHDHLDYHGTMANYIAAKKSFFDGLKPEAHAIVNQDDKRGPVMVQNTKATVHRYALRSPAEFRGRVLESGFEGMHLQVDGQDLHSLLIGEFNAYNLLAVYAAASVLEEDAVDVLRVLSRLRSAEGRFDHQRSATDGVVGIVDYAHTPDALEKVLTTIRAIRREGEQVITVVGCGGDRDKAKRPVMAKVAAQLSDRLVLTSDNPRTEEPEAILEDMRAGVPLSAQARTLVQADRREAIRTAVMLAGKGDIVLVAGKGHETYQEIHGVRHPFDDRAVLRETFESLGR
jgi:UDP-N-acetylmuramoyl-L-alanyl-D-glutamate--2,6-diaminopimelate ligase